MVTTLGGLASPTAVASDRKLVPSSTTTATASTVVVLASASETLAPISAWVATDADVGKETMEVVTAAEGASSVEGT